MKLSQAYNTYQPASHLEAQICMAMVGIRKERKCPECAYMVSYNARNGICAVHGGHFTVRNFNLAKNCRFYKTGGEE